MPFIIDPPHPAMAAGSRLRMRFEDGREGVFVATLIAGELVWRGVDANAEELRAMAEEKRAARGDAAEVSRRPAT